jgi:hypothetical protein
MADWWRNPSASRMALWRTASSRKEALDNGEFVGEIVDGKLAVLSKYDKAVLARCRELRELLDPEQNYTDELRPSTAQTCSSSMPT